MDNKKNRPVTEDSSGQKKHGGGQKSWHPFGSAIIFITIILALLIGYWFLQ